MKYEEVPVAIRQLVEKLPGCLFLRQFWAGQGVPAPVSPTTEEWKKVIEAFVPPAPRKVQVNTPITTTGNRTVHDRGPYLELTVQYTESVSGTCRYSRTDYYESTVRVPAEVVLEGEDEVNDYIMDHYPDRGECTDSDSEETFDHEVSDSEITDGPTVQRSAGATLERMIEEFIDANNLRPEEDEDG